MKCCPHVYVTRVTCTVERLSCIWLPGDFFDRILGYWESREVAFTSDAAIELASPRGSWCKQITWQSTRIVENQASARHISSITHQVCIENLFLLFLFTPEEALCPKPQSFDSLFYLPLSWMKARFVWLKFYDKLRNNNNNNKLSLPVVSNTGFLYWVIFYFVNSFIGRPIDRIVYLFLYLVYLVNENRMICVERRTQKKFEPTTFRALVGCSNHWATGNSSGEQWSIVGWHHLITYLLVYMIQHPSRSEIQLVSG